jgi:hypothetical protein
MSIAKFFALAGCRVGTETESHVAPVIGVRDFSIFGPIV